MALLSGWVRHAAFYLGRWALLLATVASPALAQSNGQTAPVEGVEKGMFVFSAWAGKPLNVFFVRPEKIDHKTMPVIVLHGANRNADDYRDAWVQLARDNNLLIVAPEFNAVDYPRSHYILGNMTSPSGKPQAKEQWVFSAIEALFDDSRARFAIKRNDYSLFGHSGGAQVGHRFLFFVPDNRARRVVLANAGWYTMPLITTPFPHGLKDSGVTEEALAAAYAKRVVVLLGDRDTDANHRNLNRDRESMHQGIHRFSRGHRFFAASSLQALRQKSRFNWSLSIAPGVGHAQDKMVIFAAPFLMSGPLEVH
jgi:pimeloyl-ACP methyl ester carboxylesterase